MNALLSFAFNTPGVAASMPLYVQEFNVNQHSFGWSLSEPTEQQPLEFEEASAAMRVVMDEIFEDARVRYGGAHSPWLTEQGDPYHFLVSIDYAYNVPEVDPLTPSGAAVKGYTPSP